MTEQLPEEEVVPSEPEETPSVSEEISSTPQETPSDFLKISCAVDNDDMFVRRVKMALELAGYESTRRNLIHVASKVVDSISCTIEGTVSSDKVTDTQISTAIETVPDKNE